MIFAQPGITTAILQDDFKLIYTKDEVVAKLHDILRDYNYTGSKIASVDEKTNSEEKKQRMANHSKIVENEIQTIRIPIIIFDGRRYNRAIDANQLNK